MLFNLYIYIIYKGSCYFYILARDERIRGDRPGSSMLYTASRRLQAAIVTVICYNIFGLLHIYYIWRSVLILYFCYTRQAVSCSQQLVQYILAMSQVRTKKGKKSGALVKKKGPVGLKK